MSAISISNIPTSLATSSGITSSADYFKQRRAEVQQLDEALQAGDLATAQQDYNNIVALGNNVLHRDNPFYRADRGLDFNAIGGALQNGNLTGARQAFAALESTYRVPPASTGSARTAAGSEGGVNIIA
jgi:hypothetical protein